LSSCRRNPSKVLLSLARRSGEVVTRDEIRREIWRDAPDGRFLLMKTTTASPREQIVIVSNWFDELKRLVPTK
jgi:hypothetical protein